MHSNLIEMKAVTKILNIAGHRETTLEPSIPIGDKGVSFDGHIAVYKDSSLKKSSLLGRIPVQVKGKTVKKFSSIQAKYKANMDDLKNYYSEGGVIFFVCEINEKSGEVEVFAKILLPLDLKPLINTFGHQGTTTIQLTHISDYKILEFVCNKFLREKKRQPVGYIGKHSFDSHEFERLKVSKVSFAPSKHFDIMDQEMYLYGVDGDIDYPIGIVQFEEMNSKGSKDIEIDGEFIPYYYERNESSETAQIILEHSFLITFNRKNRTVNFKILKPYTLESYWKTLKLFQKISIEESIKLFDGTLDFTNIKVKKGEFTQIEKELKYIERTKELFKTIGIPHNYVSKNTEGTIIDYTETLFKVFMEGKYEEIVVPAKETNTLIIWLGEDHILTFFSPNEEERIQSVASKKFLEKEISFVLEDKSESFKISPFLLVEPLDLFTAANVTLELVKDTFKMDAHINNDHTFHLTNQFCLDCLNAYDKNKITAYLELTDTIYFRMLTEIKEHQDIVTINYLQTVYRITGYLYEEQLEQLIEIKEEPKNTDNFMLRTCCSVLLNNKIEARFYFNKLDKEQKEEFFTYPIHTLYKHLVD